MSFKFDWPDMAYWIGLLDALESRPFAALMIVVGILGVAYILKALKTDRRRDDMFR